MERKDELEARVRETPLSERLSDCRKRIGKMCSEGRPPRMCIPVQWDDDDFYISTTLADAQRALDAEREKVKRLSTCGTDHSTPWWQVKCEDLEAQLATLQAQLRQVKGELANEKAAYEKLSEQWNKDSLDLQAKDAEIAAWKLELGRMRANHPEKGCYAALPKLRSQVGTLTHANAGLRELLALACDHAEQHVEGCLYCGEDKEYVAENGESSPQHQRKCWWYRAQHALADTEGQEGA